MAAAAIPHAALTPTRARHAAGRRTCTNPARARLPCPPNPADAHVATEATDSYSADVRAYERSGQPMGWTNGSPGDGPMTFTSNRSCQHQITPGADILPRPPREVARAIIAGHCLLRCHAAGSGAAATAWSSILAPNGSAPAWKVSRAGAFAGSGNCLRHQSLMSP